VEHRSVVHLGRALARGPYAKFGEEELRVAVNAPLAFDASVKQIIQILRGHTLVVVPEEMRTDGEAFAAWLTERRPDVLDATPSHLRLLIAAGLIPEEPDSGEAEPSGVPVPRCLLIGGEAIEGDLWRTLGRDSDQGSLRTGSSRTAFNVYGPTECTVDSSVGAVSAAQEPSIGRPVGNVRLWVLDRWLARVPTGVAGELCIAGDGVARGYLGRPARTAASFVPDPSATVGGERLYRTGDQVRWLPDGRIDFLGRLDRQVKLRGVRMELGELEAALQKSPKVLESLAHLRDLHGGPQLVVYVVPRRRYAAQIEGRPRHPLPNGLAVVQQNRNETDYLYEEIFQKRCYLQHGISLPDDACVLDVGANIGMFSLQVLKECSRPRIYAFEPLPAMLETLRLNIDLYAPVGTVSSYGFGLTDIARTERFTFYPRYTMMSGASDHAQPQAEVEVVKRFLENQRQGGDEGAAELLGEAEDLLAGRFVGEEIECELRRLSDVIAELGVEHVDLLKIDVQRAELEVLHGIDDGDWVRIDQVVMEIHDAIGEATEGRTREISELLEGRGFTTVVEQDELLVGTDRYNLYATRPAARRTSAGPRGKVNEAVVNEAAEGLLTEEELRELLRRRIPEYMMPAAVVMLDDFPLNRNGKIDLKALPAPEEMASVGGEEAAPARTPHEEVLVGIWGEILGIERPGVDQSFFELGGHSLLATQLMSKVRQVFQVEMPLRVLFDGPTVTELAAQVATALAESGSAPPIEPISRSAPLPLSFAQQRLWFVQQINPRSPAYNYPVGLRLRGQLHVGALERTFEALVQRHEVLRTRFLSGDGEPVQVIDPPAPKPLPMVDLGGLSEERREAEFEGLRGAEARRPVELSTGPVLRIALLRLAPTDHVVLATLHHIVTDGWSTSILTREVSTLYLAFSEGRPPTLPPLPVQYADYAVWQRRWLAGEVLEKQLRYWRQQLAGMPEAMALPADRERPERPSFRGAGHSFRFPAELSSKLEALGRAEGVTLFMTLLAGFQALLHRFTGENDIVVGTDVANRNRSEIEGLLGFFVNNLVLRTDLSGSPTFRELLAQVREMTLGAYAHQDLPFDLLVNELQPQRQLARTPLFQVLFVLQNVPNVELEIPGLRLTPMAGNQASAKFDLAVFINQTEEGIFGAWNYSTDLFDASTVARLAAQYQTLLQSSTENPDERIQRLEVTEMEATKSRGSKLRKLRGERRRSTGGSSAELVETGSPMEGASLPLLIRPRVRDLDLAGWAGGHREWIEEKLLRHGALLLRDFGITSVTEFEDFAKAVCPTLYGEYGDLPREEDGEKVYHSTPYPADKAILFHNESSHMHRWPMRQFFCCLQVAPEGGETPLVDCREIHRRLDPKLLERFAQKKLKYVRNFVEGFDVSWRGFFHTEDRQVVESYCRERDIEFQWRGDELQIQQIAPAVVAHPQTGEMLFFNQIQLHHPACLGPEERESLRSLFGDERMPRSVFFGDGTAIEDALVDEITALYWECSVAAPWQLGDIVMVDNMLCAHARNPFSGSRKIVVAMGAIHRSAEN
jgi:FkbM family methyltransferase